MGEPTEVEPNGISRYDEMGQPITDLATCGHCGRTWDDAIITSKTPVPSGRCPFEDEHEDEEDTPWSRPWTNGYAVGFAVTKGDTTTYVYLNPSDDAFYVYIGAEGDPSQDEAQHYYVLDDEDDDRPDPQCKYCGRYPGLTADSPEESVDTSLVDPEWDGDGDVCFDCLEETNERS